MAKRLYYRIGQACKQLDIQPYVLRYWETEFSALSPDKSKSGQRVYSEQDLAVIRRIKELLYDEGFTIAGAKKRLEVELKSGAPPLKAATEPSAEAPVDGSPEASEEPTEVPAEPAAQTSLDTAATERIETLRQGVREALDQTRELVAMLEEKPATKPKKKKKSASRKTVAST